MDINSYLKKLLVSQELLPEQEKSLHAHKKEVTEFLCAEFGNKPVIKYAGSYAKGTMIRDSYDLDIVCYFPSSDPRTLKEIRDDVAEHLSERYLLDRSKASAERIINLKGAKTPDSYHIDVVPGRFIENTKDVFLNVANGEKERIQTNLKTHIDNIANSGCVPVIRLVKIWSCRNKINIKTFVLELFVVESLRGFQGKDDFQKAFIKVMQAFRDDFGSTQLIDPANTNNIVSKSIDSSHKMTVSSAAEETLRQIEDFADLSNWKSVLGDETSSSSVGPAIATSGAYATGSSFQPSKPWINDDYRGR